MVCSGVKEECASLCRVCHSQTWLRCLYSRREVCVCVCVGWRHIVCIRAHPLHPTLYLSVSEPIVTFAKPDAPFPHRNLALRPPQNPKGCMCQLTTTIGECCWPPPRPRPRCRTIFTWYTNGTTRRRRVCRFVCVKWRDQGPSCLFFCAKYHRWRFHQMHTKHNLQVFCVFLCWVMETKQIRGWNCLTFRDVEKLHI